MALRNRNYVEPKDDMPVSSPPQVTAAELPEPAVDARPPEPPETKSPAEAAGEAAIKQRLREMEQAENLRDAPQPSHPQFAAEPPQQQQAPSAEQIIAGANIPDAAKNWLRQHSEYVTDPAKNARLIKMHNVAEYQAGGEFIPAYFERMDVLLGHRQEAPPSSNGNAAPRPAPAPVRQRQYGGPVSAPPSREPPSMVTGRPSRGPVRLTEEQRECCRQWGISEQQYADNQEKMNLLKRAGVIRDGG
jgi:hypothetical protein